MADWSELPIDMLGLLVQRLELIEDFYRFRAVCKSWRTLTTEIKPKFSLKFPSLVLESGNLIFYSQLTSQLLEINLPEATCKRYMGVYPGWILTVDRKNYDIDLLNPFTRRQFSLPSMLLFKDEHQEELKPECFLEMFLAKVVASTTPEQEDCIVLAIYGKFRVLAFARIGDRAWTNIVNAGVGFNDVVYYNGKFYAVDSHGVVFVCGLDNNKDGPTATVVAAATPPLLSSEYFYHKYLVESCGDLHLVFCERRRFSIDDIWRRRYFTTGFYVFRLLVVTDDDRKYPCYRMEDMFDLGDRAFFIGHNPSASISSSDCVRANSIYFCDDYLRLYLLINGAHDTGIFDLKTKKIQYHHVSHLEFPSPLNPPFWFFNN